MGREFLLRMRVTRGLDDCGGYRGGGVKKGWLIGTVQTYNWIEGISSNNG